MRENERKPIGRPTKFTSERLSRMIDLLGEGYSRRELCRELGIHHSTFYNWLKTIPFFEASVEGLEEADADRRRYRRWLNHPFRGRRPPRRSNQNSPDPKPYGAGIKGTPKLRVHTISPGG